MAPKCTPSARPAPGLGSRLHSRPLAATTFREPCFADGRAPFQGHKAAKPVLSESTKQYRFWRKRGKEGRKGGRRKKRKEGKQQGRIKGSWPELVEQVEDRETPRWDLSVPQDSHPEG